MEEPKYYWGKNMSENIKNIGKIEFSEKVLSSLSEKKLSLPSAAFMSEFSTALNQLSSMDNTDKLRADAISNGKAIIKNWRPPTDEQIDKIFINMSRELLA